MKQISGFINIIKPTGLTSSDVVCRVKKILNTKRVGHLGTLDPAASGVLPIAVGKATKFFDYFLTKEKEYIALVQFGVETETQDSFGEISGVNNKYISESEILFAMNDFIGEIEQIPPKYSAKKINGKRAYELARENIDFLTKSRKISVFSIKLLKNCEKNCFLFRVHCSAGTYIRTLFCDIAKKMGTVANVPVIIRTKSGIFDIENAITLDELENNKSIVSIESVFKDKKTIEVNEFTAKKLINGVKIDEKMLNLNKNLENDFFISFNKKLIGLYETKDNLVHCKIYLYEEEDK